MTSRILFALTLLLGPCQQAGALEMRYAAGYDQSRWTLIADGKTRCRLEHGIPGFGRALVSQDSGRSLVLSIESGRRFERGINVELRSEKPSWNESKAPLVLGRLELDGGRGPVRISGALATGVLRELHAGNQPGFLFYTDAPVIASLSSVGFGAAAMEFERCVEGLHRDHFDDVRVSNIYFDPDHEFASLEQEGKAFRRMLAYMEADPSIAEVVVTGHTDRKGLACYNEGLSRRRADYVFELLVSLGVDPELIRVDYAGESEPRRRGNSDRSHAANRRVSVELHRN